MFLNSLVEKLFTTAAIDNIDHNKTSSISSNLFHGTNISLFQRYNNVIENETITYDFSIAEFKEEINFQLPLYYSDISPASGVKSQFLTLKTNEYPRNITVNPVHYS